MSEQDTPAISSEFSTGRVVTGALLVAAGAALLVERLGAMPPGWRTGIWPVLLMGYGLARLLQPRSQSRDGLFFVLAGAWWLAGVSGWISLERTWPLLFVALGVSMMFQSIVPGVSGDLARSGGNRRGAAPWLLVAILLGAAASTGIGGHTYGGSASGDGGVLRVYSVLGGSNYRMQSTTLTGGEVVSIMGGSQIDLRDVTIAPGGTVTIDMFTLMGGGTIRVPDQWIVDVRAVAVMGGTKNQRAPGEHPLDAAAGAAPHLVVRGTIVMGGLTIKS